MDMGTKSVEPFDLETAWPSCKCATFQKYLQAGYGKLDKAGHRHAFRGVTSRFCNLWPTSDRRDITGADPIKTETHLLEEFILRAWSSLTPQERHRCLLSEKRWESKRNTATLVVARHRLVPTRCVDWSDDPLHALFFACTADSQSEGEVWWFDRKEFDDCVKTQWPDLFGKDGHVEADIERDFKDRSFRKIVFLWF